MKLPELSPIVLFILSVGILILALLESTDLIFILFAIVGIIISSYLLWFQKEKNDEKKDEKKLPRKLRRKKHRLEAIEIPEI